jgi:hypothetical protein
MAQQCIDPHLALIGHNSADFLNFLLIWCLVRLKTKRVYWLSFAALLIM